MKPSNYYRHLIGSLLVAGLLSAPLLFSSCSKNPDYAAMALQEQQEAEATAKVDDATIQKYLADSTITIAQRQPSGLYLIPRKPGSGTVAKAGRSVSVLYRGTLLNGTEFDSSAKHGGTPITFTLGGGQVIAGWDIGIALLSKGQKATLLIPSGLAYGKAGAGGVIPPNAVLRFEVELVDIK